MTSLSQFLLAFLNDYFPGQNGQFSYSQLREIGRKLALLTKRKKPYTPQYLTNILNENYGDYKSAVLTQAIMSMAVALDGRNPLSITHTKKVELFTQNGTVKPNSIILGKSKTCANPGCKISFVPRVPNANACSPDCAKQVRKLKRQK